MNIDQCANCLIHHWAAVEDPTTLQRCKRCKMIKYCGRDCQTEHWLKIHHKHCKYFADPVKAQQWGHKEDDCVICLKEAVVGITQLMRPNNPNYVCIFGEANKLPADTVHPHPFPAAGDPEDIFEKSILVLWQLLNKFWYTQPWVLGNCREEFRKVFQDLMRCRLMIWVNRKVSPNPQVLVFKNSPINLSALDEKVEGSQLLQEPFQLWKIIKLVQKISLEVSISQQVNLCINPLADMPSDLHEVTFQGAINSANLIAKANEVLDALTTQVIPYRDVLSIICGGSVEKTCTFCSRNITITDVTTGSLLLGSFALLGFAHTTMFCCGSNSYLQKFKSMREDYVRASMAMTAAGAARGQSRCDFCFKIPPSGDVHRCRKCLSVMYCGTGCRDQDWDIHKKVCKEDVEERKKKFGRSARKKEGKESLESLEKGFKAMEDTHVQDVRVIRGASEVIGKFMHKKSKK